MPYLFVVPYLLAEALTFFLLGQWIGFGWALVALVVVFFGGLAFAGIEMRAIALRAGRAQEGAGKAAGGLALTAAGAMLVAVPGFLSSILGLLLIFAPTRELIRRMAARRLRRALEDFGVRMMDATGSVRPHTSYGSFGPAGAGGPGGGAGGPGAFRASRGAAAAGDAAGDAGEHQVIDEEEIERFNRSVEGWEKSQGREDPGDEDTKRP